MINNINLIDSLNIKNRNSKTLLTKIIKKKRYKDNIIVVIEKIKIEKICFRVFLTKIFGVLKKKQNNKNKTADKWNKLN